MIVVILFWPPRLCRLLVLQNAFLQPPPLPTSLHLLLPLPLTLPLPLPLLPSLLHLLHQSLLLPPLLLKHLLLPVAPNPVACMSLLSISTLHSHLFQSATYFWQNGVAGACGSVHSDNDLIAAIGRSSVTLSYPTHIHSSRCHSLRQHWPCIYPLRSPGKDHQHCQPKGTTFIVLITLFFCSQLISPVRHRHHPGCLPHLHQPELD